MLTVGLTGGIGAGKSEVSRWMAANGAVVIDADVLAREVVAVGSDGLAEVVAAFGSGVLTGDGSLDRPALGRVVFADDAARARLNAIVHPRVAARTRELIEAAEPDSIVVHDVPLLVESGLAPGYHLVVVVSAPDDERVRRVVATRDLTEADARARLAAQASDEDRRRVADVWLDNGGDRPALAAQLDALWTDRLVPYRDNLAAARPAERGPLAVVEYDATWPIQAARLAARLSAVAGERAIRVDHIGSTSVPGLAAKDVLDMQLTVSDLDEADRLASPLGEAGFPVIPTITGDNPKPVEPDPSKWGKRFHCGADPGRAVNLHLRQVGSPGWRYALLFRDWLRADVSARIEYESLKLALARRHTDVDAYVQDKEPWFDLAYDRAESWANTTNWTPTD